MATLREVKKRIKTVVSTPVVVVGVLTLILATSSFGFDGNRKGFVLGGGLGIAPASGWSGKGTFGAALEVIDTSEYRTGVGFNFLIGHGWDEKNLIVFEINMSIWTSDLLLSRPNIVQGTVSAVWYHYFGLPGRSFFTAAGLGSYRVIRTVSQNLDQSIGGGYILGGGYEFARHWQLAGYFGLGASSEKYGPWTYTDLKVLVSAVAF